MGRGHGGRGGKTLDLIIGGAAQGKLAYALTYYGLIGADVSDGVLGGGRILYRFHLAVRGMLERGEDAQALVEAYFDAHPNCVVICDEVGCGLVPVDPFERQYRDAVGRLCCAAAERSARVVRIFCGLPVVLKDE